MALQVDAHGHLFNGADLPVRGFVRRTQLHNAPLADQLARLAERLVKHAPGFEADLARLDRLLAPRAGLDVAAADLIASADGFEHEVDLALAELYSDDPALLIRVGAGLAAEEGELAPDEVEDVADLAEVAVAADVADLLGAARRAVRWVMLFNRSRLDLYAEYVRTFASEVDLLATLLVDLGTNLEDQPRTTLDQQIALFEKLSRASMQGVLPPGSRTHVHPFIGFDPLRELRARRTNAIETPLDLVQRAVETYGFIGVKVYPPMGWQPSGNTPRPGLPAEEAAELDRIVERFAAWCEEQDVPVTAHCNLSNHAHPRYEGFGRPEEWLPVLDKHPGLRLNLGHFGGTEAVGPDAWPWTIARSTARFDHLYADVGNHRIHDPRVTEPYLAMLQAMFDDPTTATMADRILYGSDWYMLAIHPDADRFLPTYRQRFEERFGSEVTAGFMGDNARRFLGFDDPSNRNATRLRERYTRFAPDRLPDWLATDGTTP